MASEGVSKDAFVFSYIIFSNAQANPDLSPIFEVTCVCVWRTSPGIKMGRHATLRCTADVHMSNQPWQQDGQEYDFTF